MSSLRHRFCAVVAAALLAPVLLPGAALAADVEGYVVSGRPVDGVDQQAPDAPLLAPGQYTDELERGASDGSPGSGHYYRVPTPAGARLRVTAVMPMPVDRGDDSGSIGLAVELYDLDGDLCTSNTATQGLQSSNADFVATALAYEIDPEKDCGSRENLHLRIVRTQDGLTDRPLPIEILVRVEPAADLDGLPDPVEEEGPTLPIPVLGTPEPVAGGHSFGDAAALTSGATYSDTLRTGEMLFYRVPMTWGQRLTYLVRDTGPTTPVRDLPESVSVTVFNPVRSEISHAGDSDSMFNGRSTVLTSSTDYPVRHRNRENYGNSTGLAVAGDFYLVVTAMPRDDVEDPETSTTIDLTVVVSGEPDPEPGYLDLGLSTSDAVGSDASSSDSSTSGASSGSVPTGADPTGSAVSEAMASRSSTRDPIVSGSAVAASGAAPVTWWAVGGIVVVAAGTVLLLLRRRRAH